MGTIRFNISCKWLLCILLYSLHIQSATANKKLVQADTIHHVINFSDYAHIFDLSQQDDEGTEVIRATKNKKKTRYYLNASSRQFSINQRIVYPEDKQDYYILEKENKSGVYQWLDAFLPAYYNFLFRYTLF
ncbi:MAG TPA: hypothetical protein VGE90_11030 [Chitinophaga sp.]